MTRLHVLIVEDDFAVAQMTRGFVDRDTRFETVGIASTGSQALRAMHETEPDVVVLDVYLPDMSGLAVLARARAAGIRSEVIAVTAARDLETVRIARTHGVHHYLVKPFPMRMLHERLDNVWQAHRRDERLTDVASLDQAEVDALLRRDAVTAASQRKGVSPLTLERVAATLRDADGPLSAAQVGEALGMARVSARRYLERLVEAGMAQRDPRYGGAGRPELIYSPRDRSAGEPST